jgi:two-component system chemotaxis sensor kinase CheA
VLLVEVRSKQGNQAFALPLRSIQEIVNIPATVVHRLGDGEIFRLRDRVVPLKRLRSLFHMDESSSGDGGENLCVVVLGEGEKRVGVAVDGLLGQEETVVKPLGNFLGSVPGLAGATISGDGLVRLMLDPGAILKLIGN